MIDYAILIPATLLFYFMLWRRISSDMDVRHAQMRRDLARRLRHDPYMHEVRRRHWQYDQNVARIQRDFERESRWIGVRVPDEDNLWLN